MYSLLQIIFTMSVSTLKYHLRREAVEQRQNMVLFVDLLPAVKTPDFKGEPNGFLGHVNVFNVMVYDSISTDTVCYMWHEGEGIRGRNEVSACVMQHILTKVPAYVTHLTILSKCCEVLKSFTTCAMFLTALERHGSLTCIDHITFPVGHSCIEIDRQLAIINRFDRTRNIVISVPSEWYRLVEDASNFLVVPMKDFMYDFDILFSTEQPLLVKNRKTTDGENFKLRQTCWFQYLPHAHEVKVKNSYNRQDPFNVLNLHGRRRRHASLGSNLQLKEACHPLPSERVGEMVKTIHLLGVQFHSFYLNLVTHSPEDDQESDSDHSVVEHNTSVRVNVEE